jgi:tRNA (guanine37-N1)-methyltransferase
MAAKKIALVTLFPEMFAALSEYGISGRAIRQGLLELGFFNPRTYTSDRHQTVDSRPYGGGPGMVMMVEPLRQAIGAAREWIDGPAKVVYLSPQGRVLDQVAVNGLAAGGNLILLAGRYEGVDERLIELEVDEEWSIGDYVLSGGELPAMVMLDALIRQLPGALGHEDSADQDSFAGGLLDCPHYTRPEQYEDLQVPEVLLSGNHERIRQWRLTQSLRRTWQRRPDLLDKLALSDEQRQILDRIVKESADESD